MLLLSEGIATGIGSEHQNGRQGERRRGVRVRQHRPVKIYEPAGARYFGGQTEDISSTGLRIELPAFATVREGEPLSIHVGLSRKGQSLANRRQMIPARVVWVRRSGANKPGTIEAGVEFLSSIAALLDAA
jgi:c-di-GMP-binding flagellar brake protein YcgR